MQYNRSKHIMQDEIVEMDNFDSSDELDSSVTNDTDSSDEIDQELDQELDQKIQSNRAIIIDKTIYYIDITIYEKYRDSFDKNMMLKSIELHKYNKFISELPNALDLISVGYKLYDNYEINHKLLIIIDKYINSHKYDWYHLTRKTDYNLDLFRRRTLPYFNLECKDWVKANIDAHNVANDYPNIFDNDSNESINHIKNNNYLSWQILSIKQYSLKKQILLITTLYNIGVKRQALLLFLQMLQSPLTCHICKVSEIWKLFANDLSNAVINDITAYSLSYAMYILRQEETVMFSKVNDKYRVLFTLEEASSLPTFNTMHIEQSPYIIPLTDETRLSSSMIFHLIGKRRLCTSDEFKRRFILATGGAFEGIDLADINAAITGSILVPCVHISPLEELFTNCDWDRSRSFHMDYPYMVNNPTTDDDIKFLNYLEYYYPSYCSLTNEDYCKTMQSTVELINLDDGPDYEEDKDNSPNINDKSSTVIEYNQLADIDISITTKSIERFKELVMFLYEKIQDNCKHRGLVHIAEVKTISSIKYKIYGPGIPRPMDIFRISYTPAQMVKKFHLHVVKMYYNNNITLFRSCISCLLSGISESYKWFACKKVPADVILKYAQRGFTTVLNQVEREAIANYILTNERYSLMLSYLQIKPMDIYCCVTNKHAFFKPSLYSAGVRLTLRNFTLYNEPYTRLLIEYSKVVKPYGTLQFKDTKKIYPPNNLLMISALNHINYY